HRALAADLLHAMGEARKRSQALLNIAAGNAEDQRSPHGARGILRIVLSAQRTDAVEACQLQVCVVLAAVYDARFDADAFVHRFAHRDADHVTALAFDAAGSGPAPWV